MQIKCRSRWRQGFSSSSSGDIVVRIEISVLLPYLGDPLGTEKFPSFSAKHCTAASVGDRAKPIFGSCSSGQPKKRCDGCAISVLCMIPGVNLRVSEAKLL